MKNLNLTIMIILCLNLYSCVSKPEKKETIERKEHSINYTMPNYKLDDDELEKRRTEANKTSKPNKKKKLQNSKNQN
jgi:molecular chaperone DnaK (HSP70)